MSEPFLGEIRLFAGNFAPRGWAACNGQLLPINQNQALFSLLGTTYGGDGRVTFALPDLRGRVPLGMGAGPNLSPRTQGEAGGVESVTLLNAQLPTHSHPMPATSNDATTGAPVPGNLPARSRVPTYAAGPAGTSGTQLGPAGGAQPHENRAPYLCVNFVIALQGIFPSRP